MRYRRLPRPRLGHCGARRYYSITPKLKAGDDYAMLLTLPGQQYWVLTNDKMPGEKDWYVLEVFQPAEPKAP
jgi:hypothetical protein